MDLVITRENGGFVVRQGGPVGPPGPQGPTGPSGGGDVTQAELDDAVTALQTAIDARQLSAEKGALSGYAALDASGHVPAAQLTLAALVYKGTWNAATNTPPLVDGTGTSGDSYRVAVEGTRNLGSGSKDWEVGDFALYNGTIWEQLGGATGVSQQELDDGLATKANSTHSHAQSDVTGLVAALTGKQPADDTLTAFAGLSGSSGIPRFTAPDTLVLNGFSSFMQTLLAYGTDAATARGLLGVGTGGTTAITINPYSANHTLAAVDYEALGKYASASDLVVTVPAASTYAWPAGGSTYIMRGGPGALSIVPAPGVTIRYEGGYVTGKYLEDLMTDTTGTALTSHTPTGVPTTPWLNAPGSGGAGAILTAAGVSRAHADGTQRRQILPTIPESPDYDVEASVRCVSDAGVSFTGVLGRADPTLTQYYYAGWDANANVLVFGKRVSPAGNVAITTVASTPVAGVDKKIRLRHRGAQHSVYVDDVLMSGHPVTNSEITAAGRIGMGLNGGTSTTGIHLDWIAAAPDLDALSIPQVVEVNGGAQLTALAPNEFWLVGGVAGI